MENQIPAPQSAAKSRDSGNGFDQYNWGILVYCLNLWNVKSEQTWANLNHRILGVPKFVHHVFSSDQVEDVEEGFFIWIAMRHRTWEIGNGDSALKNAAMPLKNMS